MGVKLKKEVNDNGSITDTEYSGNFIYNGLAGNTSLQFFNQSEGYIEPDGSGGYDYVYQHKDHLGNIRLSYSDDVSVDGSIDPATEIREENNYYPFGLKHKGYNAIANGRNHKYGFGGKEEQDELDLKWLDFSARNYDAALGRWMNLDPLAEQMRRHSPYNYAFDNPVYFVDPDGMSPCPPGQNCDNGFFAIARGVIKGSVNVIKERINAVEEFVSDPVGTLQNAIADTPDTLEEAAGAVAVSSLENIPGGEALLVLGDVVQGGLENGVEGAAVAYSERISNKSADAALAVAGVGVKLKTPKTKGNLGNPFKNKTLSQVNKAMEKHVESGKLEAKYTDPVSGSKSFKSTQSGFSFNVDTGKSGKTGLQREPAHVDV
ncbi:MAG: RHS repeat domain-containing protein, partial [Flavobacteriaceae bacterium]